jgi:hypothetical protein
MRTLATATVLCLWAAVAHAQSAIPQSVVAGGATQASSTAFAIRATLGQPIIGAATNGAQQVLQGYWTNPYTIVSGVGDTPARHAFALEQNHPNPFNPTTMIGFSLPTAAHVRLTVYDVRGAEVLRPLDGTVAGGRQVVEVNATRLASGVYFYRLESPGFLQTRKFVVVK